MCNIHAVDEGYTNIVTMRYIRCASGFHVAQLYCRRCGGELDGEQHSYERSWGTMTDTFVECCHCGFYLSGRDALAEVEAAWQGFGRASERTGKTN